MDLMDLSGIGVVVATPTSSPPPWMGRLHPETLPRDEDGRTEWWGGRQHFSHSRRPTAATPPPSPRTWPHGTPATPP